jgi:hypothetical protein
LRSEAPRDSKIQHRTAKGFCEEGDIEAVAVRLGWTALCSGWMAPTQELSLDPQMLDTHTLAFFFFFNVLAWAFLNLPLLPQAQSGKWPVASYWKSHMAGWLYPMPLLRPILPPQVMVILPLLSTVF